MRWPKTSIESVRPSRFHPPFCPWTDCSTHRGARARFQGHGSYRTRFSCRRIPRFRCTSCRHTCSRQTFSTTYYLKKPRLLVGVAAGLAACSAQRQIARSLRCAKTSVTRLAERLGRHAILFQARCLRGLALDEPVVHDHFETFVGRQDRALGIGTAVGSESWFVYDVDPAPHRGSGRWPDRKPEMTKDSPSSPYVRSIKRTFSGLIEHISGGRDLTFVVDGRADYTRAVRDRALAGRVTLRVFPNPKRGPKGSPRSEEAIARDRAMFPVDQLHQLLRHTCSDHKRETIAFGRRLESILGRAHLMAVWKNFIKSRSERAPDRSTPAMRLGLARDPWTWDRILSRRLFSTREPVTEVALKLYGKRWTAGLPELAARHAG
jgi:transposase-like protein